MFAFLQTTTPETTTAPPESTAPVVQLTPEQFDGFMGVLNGGMSYIGGLLAVCIVALGALLFLSMIGGR